MNPSSSPLVVAALLVASVLSLGACQTHAEGGSDDEAGDEGAVINGDDPCGVCPYGYYAVDCGYLWGLGEFSVCGIGKENAEYLCDNSWAGVVLSSPSDNCNAPSIPWTPSIHVFADPASGVKVIEAELLDRLENYPQDIYLDDTRLDWDEEGNVVISAEGDLSIALGLKLEDVLVDVNGHAFGSILDVARLYETLRNAEQLVLSLVREGKSISLVFEVR